MARGIVIADIIAGRRELGWEVGFAQVGGTQPGSFTVAITLNNDADFVATRLWVGQYASRVGGPSYAPLLPAQTTMQIRDGATGNVLFREPGDPYLFASVPALLTAATGGAGGNLEAIQGRIASNKLGLPAPYVIRRGSSVLFELANVTNPTWPGDAVVALEGFRVYPGQSDPVPAQITGYALPFDFKGSISPAASAATGVIKAGSLVMPGLGQGHYILKGVSIESLGSTNTPPNCPITSAIGLDVYDSSLESKRWFHVTNPPNYGAIMPAFMFTAGDTGLPWAMPRYLGGTEQLYVDLYYNPQAVTYNPGGGAQATIGPTEVHVTGVWVPS